MALTEEQNEIMAKMEAAGNAASDKLKADIHTDPKIAEAVRIIGKWMSANYMSAGYKRLSKTLIALSKIG
jgi:hypothetical protein